MQTFGLQAGGGKPLVCKPEGTKALLWFAKLRANLWFASLTKRSFVWRLQAEGGKRLTKQSFVRRLKAKPSPITQPDLSDSDTDYRLRR